MHATSWLTKNLKYQHGYHQAAEVVKIDWLGGLRPAGRNAASSVNGIVSAGSNWAFLTRIFAGIEVFHAERPIAVT